ncbi:MAG: PKD domain-containing protein, partial [Anaerolineae bacterium]|nr:PKD domain-containing protein [Anaerolineae bacterium]
WEVHYDLGYAVAAVDPAQYQWLESLGYRLQIDPEKTALLGIHAPLDQRFYYFDADYTNPLGRYMVNFLQDTATSYGDITEVIDIGDAWQAEHGGYHRDIWVLRITNEDPAYGDISTKPVFFLMAAIHAREVSTPELAIRYIKYLTSGFEGVGGYGLDPDVTWLVNHNVAYIMVSQNPDGHRVNEANTGAYWRKNLDNDDGCASSYGVDLNRNSSFKWGCCNGSSGNPCSETYRGPSRASEPETAYFQAYFATVMIDQNGNNGDDEIPPAAPDDATGLFISLHSYQDEILWPFGFDEGGAPNNAQLQTIARKMAYYNDFYPSGFLYTVDGSTDDWTYGKFGVASFTFEVGPQSGSCGGFFPAYGCIDGIDGMTRDFWAENGPAFIFAHKIARTPYITSYGPDTQNIVVTPDSVPQGTPVALTANVADHRYGGDTLKPIAAAEYFVDAPGADGSGIAMSPADGAWGETNEDVQATVDTSGMAPGQHYILVHGRNNEGKWGPFTAVFVSTTTGSTPEQIDLEATPPSIPIVYGQATVTATLSLMDGTPVPGWPVTFTTSLGSVDPLTAISDIDGHAVTTLSAGATPGTAHVTAESAGLNDSVDVGIYIPDAPTAAFASNSPVCIGTPVAFTNLSSGPAGIPISYLWDFGDGATSTEESPEHLYAEAGAFTVVMTATNVGGSDVATGTVTVDPAPEAAFTFSPLNPQPGQPVYFYDASTNNPIEWDWDFGDGGGASIQNPIHAYTAVGTYTVSLRARNACGWGDYYEQDIVVGQQPEPTYVYLPVVFK